MQLLYHMKKIMTIIGLSALLFTSCSKDKDPGNSIETDGKATLTFDAVFGNQDFGLNKDFSASGKTFNFTKFRYWVSNVVLINTKGEEYAIPGSYYLLEETGAINLTGIVTGAPNTIYPATKREDVQLKDIKIGDYKAIRFSVGVDQKYNDNLSLQAGELSQLNGMTNISWMWLTSYIFSSVEGKVSDGANDKTLRVETGLNANYKTIQLDLPKTVHISSTAATKIALNVDVAKSLDGIDVIATPVVGAAQGTVMAAVAQNYATKVFTVKSVN